jgi:hypothetical protein
MSQDGVFRALTASQAPRSQGEETEGGEREGGGLGRRSVSDKGNCECAELLEQTAEFVLHILTISQASLSSPGSVEKPLSKLWNRSAVPVREVSRRNGASRVQKMVRAH